MFKVDILQLLPLTYMVSMELERKVTPEMAFYDPQQNQYLQSLTECPQKANGN